MYISLYIRDSQIKASSRIQVDLGFKSEEFKVIKPSILKASLFWAMALLSYILVSLFCIMAVLGAKSSSNLLKIIELYKRFFNKWLSWNKVEKVIEKSQPY